jgi:hypothetical protein
MPTNRTFKTVLTKCSEWRVLRECSFSALSTAITINIWKSAKSAKSLGTTIYIENELKYVRQQYISSYIKDRVHSH